MQTNQILSNHELIKEDIFKKSSMITIPQTQNVKKVCLTLNCNNIDNYLPISIVNVLSEQHPIIYTWLCLSALSLTLMSVFFFILP